ncbi:MAG: hypothetical protein R3D70_25420 [Rhizobiaceae bacterium]
MQTATVRILKKQIAGESAAREKAEAHARAETLRADKAEYSLRTVYAELARWKERALIAEARSEFLREKSLRSRWITANLFEL